nr:MAG TPA: hypothetical protein [Crassvirales sp.]
MKLLHLLSGDSLPISITFCLSLGSTCLVEIVS